MGDLLVIGGYFTVMLLVGWRARRGSAEAYWVAERRHRTFPVAASLVATIFGASATLGIIGLGYSRGLTGAWWSLMGGLALIPFAILLAGRIRRLEVYTLPDILGRAYGSRVSVAAALIIGLAWCGVVAAQMVAGGLLLSGVFSISLQPALALVAAVFILYTLWGGQTSVMRTDSWQIFLFVGGILACLILVLLSGSAGEGWWKTVPAGHWSFPVSGTFGWTQLLVVYPVIVGMPYLVGPDIYSRVLCARDEGSARRAALIAALLVVPLSLLLALLGLLVAARFPGLPPEAALPTALSSLAPEGLRGLIVVGLLGAVMSSADTTLLSASTIFSLNVVTPLRSRDAGSGQQLRTTRVFVVLVGTLAWAVAAFQEGIIASLLLAYTVFVGGVALPTLAGFWRTRLGVTSGGAFWAVVMGGTSALVVELFGGTFMGGTGRILPVALSGLVLVLVSRTERRSGIRNPEG